MDNEIYEIFKEKFLEEIDNYLKANQIDAKVIENKVFKANRELNAISIKFSDSNIAPNIYPEELCQNFLESFDGIKEYVEKQMDLVMKNQQNLGFEVEDINLDFVKNNIFYKILNRDLNKALEQSGPCKVVADDELLLVPYVKVFSNSDEMGSFRFTDELKNRFKLTSDEVHQFAMDNLLKEQFKIMNMKEIFKEMIDVEIFPDEINDEAVNVDNSMLVVSNQNKINGAVAIANPMVLEQINQKIGEDFFIIPSSVHEIIAVPESVVSDPADLKKMCMDVNRDVLAKEDFLSDNIMFCNGNNLKLSICNSLEELQDLKNVAEKISMSRGMKL